MKSVAEETFSMLATSFKGYVVIKSVWYHADTILLHLCLGITLSEHVIEKWIGEESVLVTDMKSTLSKCC